MRRRSERKKSSSPAPVPARRSRRSRKVSESEKTEDEAVVVQKEVVVDTPELPPPPQSEASGEGINEARASSEEPAAGSPVRKSRGSRATPKKRTEAKNGDKKVETIPEEEAENGQDVVGKEKEAEIKDREPEAAEAINTLAPKEAAANNDQEPPVEEAKPETTDKEDQKKEDDGQPPQKKDVADDDESCKGGEQIQEVKVPSPSGSLTASKDEEQLKTSSDVLDIQIEDVEERDEEANPAASCPAGSQRSERRDAKKKHKEQKPEREEQDKAEQEEEEQKENRKQAEQKPEQTQEEGTDLHKDKHDTSAINSTNNTNNNSSTTTTPSSAPGAVLQQQRSVRKRKWLTNKKSSDRAPPVLAISTDSLKNIIDDVVQPVPLSDVQLDSSSEEEGLVTSDRDSDRSVSPSPAHTEARKEIGEAAESSAVDKETGGAAAGANARTTPPPATATDTVQAQGKATVATAAPHVVRSPSPARNRASHVLYITNLVRPFTVLQLKGLLARTGKIVDEDGFWIDRIKSKCFVAYSTEDEAIETRHALHGVRWPVSNPKCLNVDFGSRTDMDRAIQSTKDEAPRFGQENTRDNQQSGNTWARLDATDKKPVRPVREWDVGKKEPSDHDQKATNDRRRGSKDRLEPRARDAERAGGQERKRSRDREVRVGRERERERERVVGGERNVAGRSRSGSPAPKNKKKDNEPPIRLLDDLFRKTKGAPCIYWLPLTPEAIAEKEVFRQKRIEEHKQRVKEREDRQKEREKDRERQRDTRRNRSNERRRSRSRDRERRRY